MGNESIMIHLLRLLKMPEEQIGALQLNLSLKANNWYVKQALRRKLAYIEKQVFSILNDPQSEAVPLSEEYEEMFEMWRNTIVIIWHKYAPLKDIRDYFRSCDQTQVKDTSESRLAVRRERAEMDAWSAPPKPDMANINSVPPMTEIGEDLEDGTLQQVYSHFDSISVLSSNHWPALHRFYAATNLTVDLLARSGSASNEEFQAGIYKCAMARLPSRLKAQIPQKPELMSVLKDFFALLLTDHYATLKWQQVRGANNQDGIEFNCRFCSTDEHWKRECPVVLADLCSLCLAPEHKVETSCPEA
jgi:hypothetical protein